MSGREQASLQSVEEMVRLIAELHDLRRRVQRAEAIAPPGGMSPQERRAALLSILPGGRWRRDPAERSARGKFRSVRGATESGHRQRRRPCRLCATRRHVFRPMISPEIVQMKEANT